MGILTRTGPHPHSATHGILPLGGRVGAGAAKFAVSKFSQERVHLFHETQHGNGLGDIGLCAGSADAILIALPRISGDGHDRYGRQAVSYTHLTLPTKLEV